MPSRVRPVAEFEGPLEVGRYYLVPCVQADASSAWPRWHANVWWPIIGPPHEDADLGVPVEHYHFDLRFLTDRFVRRWSGGLEYAMARVQRAAYVRHAAQRRRCARPVMPEFPRAATEPTAFLALEGRHAQDRLCKACPHRGMRAADMPIVDGVRVCHGHGLGWDVATGELVKRHGIEASHA